MSFQVALSGINAASEDLSVIGNNVANASTVGFKGSKMQFADVYASGGTASAGNGVQVSAIKQDFSQGTISFTSSNLDLAISGNGFFKLDDNGVSVYSRAGNFSLDSNGAIVNSAGHKLQGYTASAQGGITGAQGDLIVNSSNIAPKSTSSVRVDVNLDANLTPPASAWVGSPTFGSAAPAPSTYTSSTSTTIYDSLGNSHIMSTYYLKSATPNQWDLRFQVDGVDVDAAPTATPFTQVFDSSGALNIGSSDAVEITWTPLDSSGNANGAVAQTFAVDVANSTQFGSDFAVTNITQDGFTTGGLDNISIGSDGVLFGQYTNGQSQAMGQVTLAQFANVNGLKPNSDSTWSETLASGTALVSSPGTSGLGLVQSGAVEESNVDLTGELVKMILAQRNFQANAQTIRTADTVTQSIINLR